MSTPAAAVACPFHRGEAGSDLRSPTGCPVSSAASAFDVFDGDFQVDPADALRWSRAQEPVFFSPKLGYWVISRYEDVKAIFRDNITFSPSIALEKITPASPEAIEVLAHYNYAMDRTLVNEDEPVHMERRRSLMHSFAPEELAHHEPMVRRLTREFVDRFVDRGRADLVNEMLWEIPLTVALHFLGIPEEDMGTLRRYSVAHTANTWGRPTPDEQIAVAEAVGNFWQYAGRILEKMRRDPSGHGWMEFAIRQQEKLPEIITDSYLHSMMMAGLVAAHETTAHASANALRLLLSNRDVWDEICADSSLIPNAVEECLRLVGSIVAWRRLVTEDTIVGGVPIPKGAKLLMVTASANHDERHFENPDALDIYRENTPDHLTFGYGSHQCMGKNLARMEIRIFLEELTRRLPHMELVPKQRIEYLPNTSFRGPEHLRVQWDPAKNPELREPSILGRAMQFAIGAPQNKELARQVRVAEVEPEADGVIRIRLKDHHDRHLPGWSAGAHIDVIVGDYVRKYSLCGESAEVASLQIAVLREDAGRGGSVHIHETLEAGQTVSIRGPKNHFRLDEEAEDFVLIAGGIGVTPILAIADRLKQLGKRYHVHYAGRSRSRMAFLRRLQRDHGDALTLHVSTEGLRLDPATLLRSTPATAEVYACGPERLLTALAELMGDRASKLHVEHFSSTSSRLDPGTETAFDVELKDTELTVHVAADQTLLQALRSVGVDVTSDCEEGLCGSCEVNVLGGDVDHRDKVLSQSERDAGGRMMSCCSRAKSKRLVLAL